jgi:hypothetical protein
VALAEEAALLRRQMAHSEDAHTREVQGLTSAHEEAVTRLKEAHDGELELVGAVVPPMCPLCAPFVASSVPPMCPSMCADYVCNSSILFIFLRGLTLSSAALEIRHHFHHLMCA